MATIIKCVDKYSIDNFIEFLSNKNASFPYYKKHFDWCEENEKDCTKVELSIDEFKRCDKYIKEFTQWAMLNAQINHVYNGAYRL